MLDSRITSFNQLNYIDMCTFTEKIFCCEISSIQNIYGGNVKLKSKQRLKGKEVGIIFGIFSNDNLNICFSLVFIRSMLL